MIIKEQRKAQIYQAGMTDRPWLRGTIMRMNLLCVEASQDVESWAEPQCLPTNTAASSAESCAVAATSYPV
jgi:hypothetical protein